jgi:hypothetical protein
MELVLGLLGLAASWILTIYKSLVGDPWLIVIGCLLYCYTSIKTRQDRKHYELGREPKNLQSRRHARVRYASVADVLLHSSATTLCAKTGSHWCVRGDIGSLALKLDP